MIDTNKVLKYLDRFRDHPPPVNVEVDLSNRCNLGCKFCHFAHTHSRGKHVQGCKLDPVCGDMMELELALKIVEELTEYGVKSVTWSGGGEPTLNPNIVNIIEATPLPQGIYTNCVSMPATLANVIKRHCVWVYVSLDCINKKEFAKVKNVKPDMFNWVLDGIERLKSAEGDAAIGIGMLVTPDNAHNIQAMYDFVNIEINPDYVQFRPAIDTYDNLEWIQTAIDNLLLLERGETKVYRQIERFNMYLNWDGHGYANCRWSRAQSVITPNGKVWTCLNRRGFDGDCLGDVNKELFASIWQRAPMAKVKGDCRVMCRGHIPNKAVEKVLSEPEGHENFI